MDRLTTLTHSSLLLTKTWKADGTVEAYDTGKFFTQRVHEVRDIGELSALLTRIEGKARTCIIRGAYVGDELARQRDPAEFKPGMVRKSFDYYDDQPLHSVMLDVDGYECLTADPFTEPEQAVAEFVTCMLPDEWCGASYHWQLSSTHGHPTRREQGLKVHLWFWLARPLTSAQLKAYALHSSLKADTALFQPVQPHYTAEPVFEPGQVDPCPVRSGLVRGPLGDEVELAVDAAVLSALGKSGGAGQRLRDIASADPIAAALADKGLIKSETRDGYNIECPFSDEHTGESGETSTQYRFAHTNGHAQSSFMCRHTHCAGRTRGMFLARLGIDEVAGDFEDVAEQPDAAPVRAKRKGIPEAQHLTTDQANAARILDTFGKRLIVVAGQWYAWTGARWEKDDGEVYRYACKLSKLIHAEADGWLAKPTRSAEEKERNAKVAEALTKWAQKSEMKASIEAAVGLAKKMLAVGEDQIDRDPWLLNCANGTVDLRTGEIRAHDPDDFITKMTPLAYDPSARSEVWDAVLARVTLEEGMTTRPLARFLQRWFGYCATGSTREQCFVVHYGQGSNGKSTVLDTIAEVLGDYAATAAPGLLVGNGKDRHPTEIADLFGRRMVTAHETGEGGHLKEDTVKQLTGGDKVKARFMRADFFEFPPTHKLQLLTNHKPVIKGSDNGIWRRVLLVPYLARWASAEEVAAGRAHFIKDTRIAERLRAEIQGVLSWVVEGARFWFQDGLQPPDAVLAASRDYQAEQDRVGQFVAECCELGDDCEAPLAGGFGSLYEAYRTWCSDGGFHSLSKQRFSQEIERAAISTRKVAGKVPVGGGKRVNATIFKGIRVIDGF